MFCKFRLPRPHQSEGVRSICKNSEATPEDQKFSAALVNQAPIDPDVEERRDQRIGSCIVILAYGGGLLILAALFALAKLL
jgi:hypothetical protein